MLNNNKKQETQFFGTKCGNANSIAAGYATETTNYGEIATGILNKSTKGDNPNSPEGVVGDPKATLFSVGCGTKEKRKNALEVKGDGSVIISGKDGSDVNIADLADKLDQPSVDLSEYVNKNELAATESAIQKQIATKANAQDVTNAIGELQDSIKNIAVTGGASTAAAVTFDNAASGMTAVNAQGAIEELNVKKLAKADIVQEPGNSEELVMSQKAVSDKLKGLSTEIIYDVSAHNDRAVFESLQALLSSSNLSTLIPTSVRCGGMSIRFIQSDNKYVQYRLMTTSFSTIESDWLEYGINETIVQSTDDYTLTDLVWTDTGVNGLKNSSDFWLKAGDKLNFSYTASYGGIIQQKKSDGTYVSLFSSPDVQTLTAFKFICQVGGYYRFKVNSIENIVITPSYTADKKESISSATNSLSKQILDIESGISRCEEFLIESRLYNKNTGKVWNQATSELVSVSFANSSCVAIIEVEGVTDIHFKRSTWFSSYCPTFFSTKNSDEFNAETMVGYASVDTTSKQNEFYVSVPANAKVICISLKNDIEKSQNYFFRKYYNKEPAIKVKRTWASIGDSITRINNYNLYSPSESAINVGKFKTIKGYQGYLQERIKFDGFTNLGVNGANSLTYPWDDITVANIYTIALGINDWGAGNAVGTISDYKSWTSGDTVDNFAKGIARIVKKIRTLNAYADIVIMTPTKAISGYFPTSSNSPSNNGQRTYLHEYADMLIEIADYEGFPVVDIYHHGNYNDGNIPYWTYDKCHPNDRGSRKIANLLFPVMRYFSDEYYTKN